MLTRPPTVPSLGEQGARDPRRRGVLCQRRDDRSHCVRTVNLRGHPREHTQGWQIANTVPQPSRDVPCAREAVSNRLRLSHKSGQMARRTAQ